MKTFPKIFSSFLCLTKIAIFSLGLLNNGCTPLLPNPPLPTTPLHTPPPESHAPSFSFAPYRGVSGTVSDRLLRQIRKEAPKYQITLALHPSVIPTYRVQGRISTAVNQSSGVVFYRHEIFDRAGIPLLRLTGQEAIPGTLVDPWGTPPNAVLKIIAENILQDLQSWSSRSASRTSSAP